jgi:hypothetical protein
MSDSRGGHPIQFAVVVLLLVGGGWYFFNHYNVSGLDGVSISPKDPDADPFISYRDVPHSLASLTTTSARPAYAGGGKENPFAAPAGTTVEGKPPAPPVSALRYRKLRIAAWALDGFGPTKFANREARKNIAQVVRQYDVVAIQQIASIERDLIARLVEVINDGDPRYDFVMGESSGPVGRQEQLAFIFDRQRVVVDRQQTYTVEDPQEQMTYDPLVAWFRAAEPPPSAAWTFSLVNVRIDLARAPSEVALLANMLAAVRQDGRGEDDVVIAGLFQADDAYLIPSLGEVHATAAVNHRPTDIFGRYQTSNILFDSVTTSEHLGGGGVHDYLRQNGLSRAEAEAVTSHLPVYAEFTATEGGQL